MEKKNYLSRRVGWFEHLRRDRSFIFFFFLNQGVMEALTIRYGDCAFPLELLEVS